jgi:protein SCO1
MGAGPLLRVAAAGAAELGVVGWAGRPLVSERNMVHWFSFRANERNRANGFDKVPHGVSGKWAAGSALSALAIGAAVFATTALANVRFGQNVNVPLITQDGKQVHFYDDVLKGKTVAVNFIYTRCMFTCPLETARMAQVQKILGDRVGKDIFLYSVSIDPDYDTPAVLKQYMQDFDIGPGWTFLTGKRADIDMLAFRLGLTDDPNITSEPGPGIDGHTPHILIGNEPTEQWMRNNSTDNPSVIARLLTGFLSYSPAVHSVAARAGGNEGAPLKFTAGQYLFAKDCAACHTVGRGDKIGPDLKYVTRARGREWLERFIREPDKMREAGDPTAVALAERYKVTMPNLYLGDQDIAALLDYLNAAASQ